MYHITKNKNKITTALSKHVAAKNLHLDGRYVYFKLIRNIILN